MQAANSFFPLSNQRLPSPYRILPSSCCPDKDLLVLISRLGGKDRLSLWKMQGGRSWEVDVGTNEATSEDITGLAWSPNGQIIAVAHNPSRITLHSVQDGKVERQLSLDTSDDSGAATITDVWWFREEKPEQGSQLPDMFKRNGIVPGSVHSVLKMLPLLDTLEDESAAAATNLFAFQGSKMKTAEKSSMPEFIRSWPALPQDLLLASICQPQSSLPFEELTEVEDTNANSILIAADDSGCLHCFLDGSYPLGIIDLEIQSPIISLYKPPQRPVFYAFPRIHSPDARSQTDLAPVKVDIRTLRDRKIRDMAQLSSTARELTWYLLKAVNQMKDAWMGSTTETGACLLGRKWLDALHVTQRKHGQVEPNGILDLTCLLVTGRATEALQDFLGSAEQMSERGLNKWETTIIETLVKVRDTAEKLFAPACQRLHLVMEEISALSQLPQYNMFLLKEQREEISNVAQMLVRAITLAAWLAASCRKELLRFREFMTWVSLANPPDNTGLYTAPRHDMLELNEYFTQGLISSSVDRFFSGPIPTFSLTDLGVASKQSLNSVIKHATKVATDSSQMSWQMSAGHRNLDHLDRNLCAVVDQIAISLHTVIEPTSDAAARTATVVAPPNRLSSGIETEALQSTDASLHKFAERVIKTNNEPKQGTQFTQRLAVRAPFNESSVYFLSIEFRSGKAHDNHEPSSSSETEKVRPTVIEGLRIAVINYYHPHLPEAKVNILETEFFDDERLVLLYKLDGYNNTFIGLVPHHDLGYHSIYHCVDPPSVRTREHLVHDLINGDKLSPEVKSREVSMPITQCRLLTASEDGVGSLAVNGKAGRTVACVLDGRGITLETLDLEGDSDAGDEMETEDSIAQDE